MQASFFGLALKGLELTLNFSSNVINAGKMSIHLSKLTLAFCFAFFMLQNASSFFDESTAIFWTG